MLPSSLLPASSASRPCLTRPRPPLSVEALANARRILAFRAVAAFESQSRVPRQENTPGEFFVDQKCIDCDACRWIAPRTYSRINDKSAVEHQPQSSTDRTLALQAMLACPTYSIHAPGTTQADLQSAIDGMPMPVTGTQDVHHLVMAAFQSFGASSYLIQRPGGNVIIDCPRFDRRLLKRIQAMGGAKYMFLTHRDDVCDHAEWTVALGCTRILHRAECHVPHGTNRLFSTPQAARTMIIETCSQVVAQANSKVEVQLEGAGPWKLPDGSDDIDLIFTPGHVLAHVVLLYKPDLTLFTGDHWCYNGFTQRGSLMRPVNYHSLDLQMESLAALQPLEFLHVLPGHQRRMSFKDKAAKDACIAATIAAEKEDPSPIGARRRHIDPFMGRPL